MLAAYSNFEFKSLAETLQETDNKRGKARSVGEILQGEACWCFVSHGKTWRRKLGKCKFDARMQLVKILEKLWQRLSRTLYEIAVTRLCGVHSPVASELLKDCFRRRAAATRS